MLTIKEASEEGESLDAYRQMLREHREATGVDFNIKGYEQELFDPLARFAKPMGVIAVAYWNNVPCATGALQDHGNGRCELKRIYVRPKFRQRGIARKVSEYLISRAAEIGYRLVFLDTLRRLTAAIRLYQSLGFVEVDSRVDSPTREVVVMERSLNTGSPKRDSIMEQRC